MAFFNDIGKKISQAGHEAVEKTKDMAEVTRLNSVIKEKNEQADEIFRKLGEAYFNRHRNDAEPALRPMVAELISVKNVISESEKAIGEIKGVRRCPHCGEEVEEGLTVCPYCHRAMPKTDAPTADENRIICPKCGYPMKQGSNFCIMCGTPVEQKTDSASPTTASEPVKAAAPVTQPTETAEEKTADSIDDTLDDEIAARAAARIKQMTQEKETTRILNGEPIVTIIQKPTEEKSVPSNEITVNESADDFLDTPDSIDDAANEALPDFDSIDDSLVVEEQLITDDAPKADVAFVADKIPQKPQQTPARTPYVPRERSTYSTGAKHCMKCGAPLSDNAAFCTKCGTPIKKAAKKPPVCPGCGAFIKSGMDYCPECGMKLTVRK